ncbi:MAG: hypothetical protein WDM80_16480 [Limisphaerales bacterium]
MSTRKPGAVDPNQAEFGIIWQLAEYPFRLRAGDIFRFDGRLCLVLRVNYSAAVVIMNRPVRDFKTRFTTCTILHLTEFRSHPP